MNAGSDDAGGLAVANCLYCQLPLDRPRASFCCSGCGIAYQLRDTQHAASPAGALLARVVVSAVLAMGVMVFSFSLYRLGGELTDETAIAMRGLQRLAALLFTAPIVWLLGVPLAKALPHLGRRLSADALILAGVTAGGIVSVWNTFFDGPEVYFETVAMVLVLVSLGRWLELAAKERARSALVVLVDGRVESAVRLDDVGDESEVAPDALRIGDRVRVRPGRTIPVDGVVLEGSALVDTANLTGESLPRALRPGDRVLAGTCPTDGTLVVRAEATVGNRVQDAIEAILADAMRQRGPLVQLADRIARAFLPAVTLVACATFALRWRAHSVEGALLDALSVLLIACPCALGLATPLAAWIALGEAWRRRVLVRGGDTLERLARTRRVFFDKTGTLTKADVRLTAVVPADGMERDEALRLAASLEHESEHVLARATLDAWRRTGSTAQLDAITGFRVLPGRGIAGELAGQRLELVRADSEDGAREDSEQTVVALVRGERTLARLYFAAEPRREAAAAVDELCRRGLAPTILSGDAEGPTRALGQRLGIDWEAELLPADKARRVGATGTAFVGDGLNDAAALAAADVGIAMHGASPRSLESAAVNLLEEDLELVPFVLELARNAVRTARWNLVWAFAYNTIGVGLAATGRLTPVLAAAAMVLSSALVVGNSLRLRSSERTRASAPAGQPSTLRAA